MATVVEGADPNERSEVDNISEVRREVYRFLKHGMVAGRTCDFAPELDNLRVDTIKLRGSKNGKSFTLTITR